MIKDLAYYMVFWIMLLILITFTVIIFVDVKRYTFKDETSGVIITVIATDKIQAEKEAYEHAYDDSSLILIKIKDW